jgi:hypothetical protein
MMAEAEAKLPPKLVVKKPPLRYFVSRTKQHGTFNDAFQLADVTWPVVVREPHHRFLR